MGRHGWLLWVGVRSWEVDFAGGIVCRLEYLFALFTTCFGLVFDSVFLFLPLVATTTIFGDINIMHAFLQACSKAQFPERNYTKLDHLTFRSSSNFARTSMYKRIASRTETYYIPSLFLFLDSSSLAHALLPSLISPLISLSPSLPLFIHSSS